MQRSPYSLQNPKSWKQQAGLTLIEVLGTLALGAGLMVFMIQIINDMGKTQYNVYVQRHHQVMANAAASYVENNWTRLSEQLELQDTDTAARDLRITMKDLVEQNALPIWWPLTNPVGQSTCLLVKRQPSTTPSGEAVLQALLVTEGGTPIKIENIWTAAGVNGHGIGILDRPAQAAGGYGAVQARGLFGQWEESFDSTGVTRKFLGTGCPANGNPAAALEAGHLATWLTVRNPREVGALQVVKRQNATATEHVTMIGALTLPQPDTGTTVLKGDTPIYANTDSCTAADEGKTAATTQGQVLLCLRDGDNYNWLLLNAATAVDRVSAPQFALLKTVTDKSTCNDSAIGELARVADGAMAYCSRLTVNEARANWKWRKVGGKWKFTRANVERKYMVRLPWGTGRPAFDLGSTARALQMQIFLEPPTPDKTWAVVTRTEGSVDDFTIGKTCCSRILVFPYMSGPITTSSPIYDLSGHSDLSGFYIYLNGYVEDDNN